MPRAPQPRFPSKRTLKRQPAPPGLYASTYDPRVGAAICRRIAAGESLRSICRDDPSMPTEKTVWNWARAHREFRAMKDHAFAVSRRRSLAAREAAEFDRWMTFGGAHGRTGRPSSFSWGVAHRVLEGLVVGETLAAICRRPGMPSVGTVYNWLKTQPAFLAEYRKMKTGLAGVLYEIACEHLVQPERERDFEPQQRRPAKQAERRARRLSLKLYAATAHGGVRVVVEAPDGTQRVIYDGAAVE